MSDFKSERLFHPDGRYNELGRKISAEADTLVQAFIKEILSKNVLDLRDVNNVIIDAVNLNICEEILRRRK